MYGFRVSEVSGCKVFDFWVLLRFSHIIVGLENKPSTLIPEPTSG